MMRSVFGGRFDVALLGPDGSDDITDSALLQLLIGHQVAPVCPPAAVRNIDKNKAMEPRASEPIRIQPVWFPSPAAPNPSLML